MELDHPFLDLDTLDPLDGPWDGEVRPLPVPGAGGVLPPALQEPPRRARPPAEPDEMWALSWALLGSVFLLGLLKLAFFATSSVLATMLVSVLFVAAHGAFIAIGGSWFWGYRHR